MKDLERGDFDSIPFVLRLKFALTEHVFNVKTHFLVHCQCSYVLSYFISKLLLTSLKVTNKVFILY